MPLSDDYLLREGDIVVLHAKVKYDLEAGDDIIFVSVREHDSTSVPLSRIVGLHCRRWDVGTRVVTLDGSEGEVVGVYEDQAWVKFAYVAAPITFHANLLAPAPMPITKRAGPAIEPPAAPTENGGETPT